MEIHFWLGGRYIDIPVFIGFVRPEYIDCDQSKKRNRYKEGYGSYSAGYCNDLVKEYPAINNDCIPDFDARCLVFYETLASKLCV